MTEFLKDYGAIVGPSLAFVLGMLTLYIKQMLDRREEMRKSTLTFTRFFKDISNFRFPSKFYPNRSSGVIIHADQARNGTNLSRYYSQLLMYIQWMDAVEKNVYLYGSGIDVRIFNQIIWFSKFQLEKIEEIRNSGGDYDEDDYRRLVMTHNSMLAGLHGGDDMTQYIGDLKEPSSSD